MLQFLLLHCYPAQAGCSPFAVHSLAPPQHILHGMGKVGSALHPGDRATLVR